MFAFEYNVTVSDGGDFVTVDSPAVPGLYQLEVGWYLPANGKRLAVKGPSTTNTNSVLLGLIEVTQAQ